MKYKTQGDESEQSSWRARLFSGSVCLTFPKLCPEASCLYFLTQDHNWQIFTQADICVCEVFNSVQQISWTWMTQLFFSGVAQPLCASLPACWQSQRCFSITLEQPSQCQRGHTELQNGINSHIPHIFWEVVSAERHTYRKERTVKEKEHGWSPTSRLTEIRGSN